jgi:hypothetical protein
MRTKARISVLHFGHDELPSDVHKQVRTPRLRYELPDLIDPLRGEPGREGLVRAEATGHFRGEKVGVPGHIKPFRGPPLRIPPGNIEPHRAGGEDPESVEGQIIYGPKIT